MFVIEFDMCVNAGDEGDEKLVRVLLLVACQVIGEVPDAEKKS
jgi:hypothetical protein